MTRPNGDSSTLEAARLGDYTRYALNFTSNMPMLRTIVCNDIHKFYPTQLMSFKSAFTYKKRYPTPIYVRSSSSFLLEVPEGKARPSFSPIEDFYGDRNRYMALKRYKECPTAPSGTHSFETDLKFDSCFECGNLLRAHKLKEREYALLMQHDTGSSDYAYWYYFSVNNKEVGTYRFHIINFTRPEPNVKGPVVWSSFANQHTGLGWHRAASDIEFTETTSLVEYLQFPDLTCYTLSFSYTFEEKQDCVYFAYSYPYSYTKLTLFLTELVNNYSDVVRVFPLCNTLFGNSCECVAISESGCVQKTAMVLTGRVHPCETNASYMIEGVLSFLVSKDPLAVALRRSFVIYVVPMLNPDGVRHGNSRCSGLGVDLNRRWLNPNKVCHPTIYYTKQLMQTQKLLFYCDVHGHSKKKVFSCMAAKEAPGSLIKAELLL